ncbi:hypothetical protein BD779DRAFT_1673255 [Infundibulicybe gibba]|nr:hypothetical protein BD779DRAFT_1673255 [Infundibulicybe gibba]
MPGLLSLSNELLSKIAGEVFGYMQNIAGHMQAINTVVSPRLFSSITINIDEERINLSISQLEALATNPLVLGICPYSSHSSSRAPLQVEYWSNPTSTGRKLVKPKNPKADWAEERMHELLPEALSALKGTTAAIWSRYDGDLDWASALVSEFLGALPALGSLHLTKTPGHFGLRAHPNQVSNLTRLTAGDGPDTAIAGIIANSPRLTRLDILASDDSVMDRTGTLHNLLKKVSLEQPLRLEHLGITGYCVRFDDETLPHLRHLRSLELKSIPRIPDDERQDYAEDLLSKMDRFGSSPKHLWRAVRREEIPIEIVVTSADDAVIDYLASATCVKKIELFEADTDALAKKFFTQVIPRHSKTLVSLSIWAEFQGLWCFGKHNVDVLLECTQLSQLSISVNASPVDEEEEVDTDGPMNQIMAMAAQMPNLFQLELFPANLEMLRETRNGTPSGEHFCNTSEALCRSIVSFGPVDPAIHPNLIEVTVHNVDLDYWKFQPRRGADGVIKYVGFKRY